MQVRITSDGTNLGTKVTTAEGHLIQGLTGVSFRAEVDDISRAELHLSLVRVDSQAEARFFVKGREVRRIEYADGTADDFPTD